MSLDYVSFSEVQVELGDDVVDEVEQAFNEIISSVDPDASNFVDARFDVVLSEVRGNCERFYTLTLFPKIQPGWTESEKKYSRYGTWSVDGDFEDALKSIPRDDSLAYRGMSWEEWVGIVHSGEIRSRSRWSFEGQQQFTFFSNDPSVAVSYAGSFAPWMYIPTPNRPGVVIAVPIDLLMDWNEVTETYDRISTSSGEFVTDSAIPMDEIVDVWFLVPVRMSAGFIELVFDPWTGGWREGSRSSPSISTMIIADAV